MLSSASNHAQTQTTLVGRFRLGVLLATAAAFLLVPAVQASAAPEFKFDIVTQPGASGEVTSNEEVTEVPGSGGTPPIECHSPSEEGDVCATEGVPAEGGWALALNAIPGPESKVGKWEVSEPGIPATGCEEGFKLCVPATLSETEPITVTVEFANEVAELHLDIVGIEGGGGAIKSPYKLAPFPGTPPIECSLPEGGEQEGVCDNVMEEIEPGAFGVSLEVSGSGPNSDFVEWEVAAPGIVAGGCGESTFCIPASEGGDVTVTAIFECKEGKECPEPEPEFPLSVECTGSGSGSVSPVDCGESAEYENGTEVTLSASADTGSEFTGWTGCESEPEPNECVVTIAEPGNEVTANFEPETFALTLTPIGEGTLEAECEGGACPAEIPYGTSVEVTATPDPLNSLESMSGACSAAAGPEEAASCEFEIKANSEVTAVFVPAAGQQKHQIDPVFGEVDQQTTLETEFCDEIDLGPFVPSKVEEEYPNNECTVTATATGTENELRAADETGGAAGPTDQVGYLTQEPGDEFTLNNALEVQGETAGLSGSGIDTGEFLPLSSVVHLVDYPEPVSYDVVTVNFRQLIDAHEGLHTGTYDKTITLTLEQTVL